MLSTLWLVGSRHILTTAIFLPPKPAVMVTEMVWSVCVCLSVCSTEEEQFDPIHLPVVMILG